MFCTASEHGAIVPPHSPLAALFVSVMLVGCASTGQPMKTTGEPMTPTLVMSFNIRYGTAEDGPNQWDNRRELVFEVLSFHDPEIVGLQEALHFQLEETLARFPYYGHVGIGRNGGEEGEYSPILFDTRRFELLASDTFWLSDTPEVAGSITWDHPLPRICTWARLRDRAGGGGRTLYVYNTHFSHVAQPARERSIELIAQRIANREHQDDPVILMGDFNAGEENPVVEFVVGKRERAAAEGAAPPPVRLVDTFRAVHPDAVDVGTSHRFDGRTSGAKIDYVFVSPGAEIIEATILHDNEDGRYPSDHYPVTAGIRFND